MALPGQECQRCWPAGFLSRLIARRNEIQYRACRKRVLSNADYVCLCRRRFERRRQVVAIYARQLRRMGHDVSVVAHPPFAMPLRRKLKSLLTGKGWPRAALRHRSHLDGAMSIFMSSIDRGRLPIETSRMAMPSLQPGGRQPSGSMLSGPAREPRSILFSTTRYFRTCRLSAAMRPTKLPLHKIVIARWLKDVMAAQYGDNVVDLVPNSVDQDQFFAPIRDKQPVPTVGCLYSSHAFKGLDVTLAALHVVRKKNPDLRLIAFGLDSPPSGVEFTPTVQSCFRLRPKIGFEDLYARCDVWVTASRSEGFNLPAIEAMACRTPVVSTRTGWPEEAIRSRWNGVLVNIDDCEGLVEGVQWVLSRTNQQWKELSAQCVLRLRPPVPGRKSARMFEEALEHARRRAARGVTPAMHRHSHQRAAVSYTTSQPAAISSTRRQSLRSS